MASGGPVLARNQSWGVAPIESLVKMRVGDRTSRAWPRQVFGGHRAGRRQVSDYGGYQNEISLNSLLMREITSKFMKQYKKNRQSIII